MNPRDRLIAALDVPSLDEALRLADSIAPHVGRFKVGLELFSSAGPEVIHRLAERAPVMLDLKLHDIPATVSRAVQALAANEVEMITLHAEGGSRMMREAAAAAPQVKLLAVTVLTSLEKTELDQLGITGDLKEVVAKRATLAVASGCAGVVTSPREASMLRRLLGPKPVIVTPGVRPNGCAGGDQKRFATPREAIAAGADFVVVGRPIRDAANPAEAARAIVAEIETGLAGR